MPLKYIHPCSLIVAIAVCLHNLLILFLYRLKGKSLYESLYFQILSLHVYKLGNCTDKRYEKTLITIKYYYINLEECKFVLELATFTFFVLDILRCKENVC